MFDAIRIRALNALSPGLFDDYPSVSPYMLFNARVISPAVPAVIHRDRTSRVQTVDASCGEYHRLLQAFRKRTGVPAVLNTSFNGPREPIVERPEEALEFLFAHGLDAL